MAGINSVYQQQYMPYVNQAAANNNIPPGILAGVIQSESSWNPNAVSPTGVYGLAQFTQGTAAQYGVNRYNPISNINGAAAYLSDLYNQKGNWYDAINTYKGNNPAGTQKALDYAQQYGYTGDTGSGNSNSSQAATGDTGSSGSWLDQIKEWLAGSGLGIMIGIAGAVLILGAIWALLNKNGMAPPVPIA